MKKSDVNGDNTNEVFKWLKAEKSGLLGLSRIKVRFQNLQNNLLLTLSPSGISRNSLLTNMGKLLSDGRLLQHLKLSMPILRRSYDWMKVNVGLKSQSCEEIVFMIVSVINWLIRNIVVMETVCLSFFPISCSLFLPLISWIPLACQWFDSIVIV